MVNELFGWLWILVGFVSGAILGVRFHREDWLGGYASHRRRLIRLGHISFLGLGLLNILFALSLQRAVLPPGGLALATWAMVIGAVTMPLCCGLMAWRPTLQPLFAVPVGCLFIGVGLLIVGMMRR